MFDREAIEIHPIENVPLDRDIHLMDVKWMADYERGLLDGLAGGECSNGATRLGPVQRRLFYMLCSY